MITVTKQTEQEQREMYEKMKKREVIDMLIESNKHLNRILENTLPIHGIVSTLKGKEKLDFKDWKIKNNIKKNHYGNYKYAQNTYNKQELLNEYWRYYQDL